MALNWVDNAILGALSEEHQELLERYPQILENVLRLKPKHKKMLPSSITAMSASLTQERSARRMDYLQDPASISAYCWYFLPWNLIRLGMLLPSLPLTFKPHDTIVDLGSGPLTLVQALWMSRPDLRDMPLNFTCVDRAKRPLGIGRSLFEELAGKQSKWRIFTVADPLDKWARSGKAGKHKPTLIAGANVLNEISWGKDVPLESQVAGLVHTLTRKLADNGQLLMIEPGTRLGGKLTEMARKGALDAGGTCAVPCTHDCDCPMLDPLSRSWCHFTTRTVTPPRWLVNLTKRAGLDKESLSISYVLLNTTEPSAAGESQGEETPTAGAASAQPAQPEKMNVRVLSFPIKLPGDAPRGWYGCSPKGLVLLCDKSRRANLVQGQSVEVTWPAEERKDQKSGAVEIDV